MSKLVEQRYYWSDGDGGPPDYEFIADIEWRGESWEFDLTRFYRRRADGAVFFADDSGCSCPTPFENLREEDLTPVKRMQDAHDHLRERAGDTPAPFVVDQMNGVIWKLDEILSPDQRPFGAIKHAA